MTEAGDPWSEQVRYPDVHVELAGQDGNAHAVLGLVLHGLRNARVPKAERDRFLAEASSGDYDHLLRTCMKWVDVY